MINFVHGPGLDPQHHVVPVLVRSQYWIKPVPSHGPGPGPIKLLVPALVPALVPIKVSGPVNHSSNPGPVDTAG